MNPAALLAAVGLFQAPALPRTIATASARVETRVRQPAIAGSADRRAALDFDTSAVGGLSFGWKRSHLELSYSPRFTLTDITGVASKDLMNSGGLSFGWHARRLTLGASQFVSYGTRWYSLTSPTETNPATGMPVIQAVPFPESVLYVSTITALNMGYQLSRRSSLSSTVSYSISGGANDESRRVVPLTTTAAAGMRLDWIASHLDTLGPQLAVSYSRSVTAATTQNIKSGFVSLTGVWSRRWARRAGTSLGAGAVLVRQFEPNERTNVYPQAAASANYSVPLGSERGMLNLSLNTALTSQISALTGEAQQILTGSAIAEWTRRRLTLRAALGVSHPLFGTQTRAVTALFADAGSRLALTRTLTWELGVRVADQTSRLPNTSPTSRAPSGTQIGAYTALTLVMLPERL